MEITPEIIPHNEFHRGVWFLPVVRPLWYYFKKGNNQNNIHNPEFLKSVDEQVRELVSFLHDKGIKTTPSCAGHFRNKKNYEKIFNSLEKDEKEIKSNGLKLQQVENGNIHYYKNKDYTLPFNRNAFFKKINEIQQRGTLGLRLGNNQKIKNRVLKLKIDSVDFKTHDGIVFIRTFGNNEKNNERIWKKITSEIKNILQWIEYQ